MKPGDLVTWFDERVGPRFGHVVRVMESAAIVERAGVQSRLPLADLRALRDGPRVEADGGQRQLEHLPAARR